MPAGTLQQADVNTASLARLCSAGIAALVHLQVSACVQLLVHLQVYG